MEYVGSGSGRSMAFQDLLMRKSGSGSDRANLSRLIMASIEVKGAWQTPLPAGMSLDDALHDSNLGKSIMPALQQVRPIAWPVHKRASTRGGGSVSHDG
jgi:hypothetical protein